MTTPREIDPETRIHIRSQTRTEYRLGIIGWVFIFAAGFLVGGLTGRHAGAKDCTITRATAAEAVAAYRGQVARADVCESALAGTIDIIAGDTLHAGSIYTIEPGAECDAGDEPAYGRNDRCWDNPPLREAP